VSSTGAGAGGTLVIETRNGGLADERGTVAGSCMPFMLDPAMLVVE
jgi:hypothetical protein